MNTSASILVIDDEPNNFDVIQALLGDRGYIFHYASSGQRALERLGVADSKRLLSRTANAEHRFQPDLILLDVMMPALDGIEVCRRIKAAPQWRSVPIIMVTALADKADLERCMSTGADDFIAKPVHRIELLARVSSRLRVKQHNDSLQIANQRLEAKGHSLAMMSDRMRNTINNVLGATQLLTATALTPEQDEHVRTARINGEILLTIANDFAAIAQSDADTLTLAQNSALLEPQRGRGA